MYIRLVNMVKICALIRTYNCKEFVIECIKSIYDYVDRVVFVHSDKGWDGSTGNTCHQKILDQFKDTAGKLEHLVFDTSDQIKQFEAGIDWLESKNVLYDHLMVIDTDEVCDTGFWGAVTPALESNATTGEFRALRVMWRAFIKSPFYEVSPNPMYAPVVFVHRSAVRDFLCSIRGAGLNPAKTIENAFLLHFTAVRPSFHEVWSKIEASSLAERKETVPKQEWLENVWNKLPNATDIHYVMAWKKTWKGVKEITIDQLPEIMHGNPIVKSWQRHPKGCYGGKRKVADVVVFGKPGRTELMRKYGIPEGFGPQHPDWKSKSKRNKYQLFQDELNGITDKPVKLAVMTIINSNYQWYAPMFRHCLQKELPDVTPLIYGNGFHVSDGSVVPIPAGLPYPADGYTTAAMRFVFSTTELESFDAVLITDIDMMMVAEPTPLAQQHLVSMRRNGLRCYDNYISGVTEGNERCPGVHFVTKDWWEATREARARYAKELMENGSRAWWWDEALLLKIIRESGLPNPPRVANMWAGHGVHLGDWRRRIMNKSGAPALDAMKSLFIKKLMADKEFVAIATECAEHLSGMKETLELWRRV